MKAGLLFAAFWTMCASHSLAEVRNASEQGFVIEHTLEAEVAPARLYEALVTEIQSWWDPSHTYSGDAGNLYIKAVPGGCFCENLENGGFVRHMEVVFTRPARELRLSGGLGPLQELGISGTMTFRIEEIEDGSRLTLSYRVSGYLENGLAALASPVDRVLGQQMQRLERHLTGSTPRRL